MRNYLIITVFFLVTVTQAQIMLPAYQAIQYRRKTLPTIITTAITPMTGRKAASGGTITSDGGAPVTVRGICWSTNSGPTIALTTKTNNGSGIGVFTSIMQYLTPGVTYYVRAYATNNIGTAYGNEIIYVGQFSNCGTLTDIDGNTYETIIPWTNCGDTYTACWTKTNLKVSKYSDGTPIPQVTDNTTWKNLRTGAWCYVNNDPSTEAIYGKLYNWYAVMGIYDSASLSDPSLRKSIAPAGWHVPSDSEFHYGLIVCLGGVNVAGPKLKSTDPIWSCAVVGTNSSGWSAAEAGRRSSTNGGFQNSNAYFWSKNGNTTIQIGVNQYLGDASRLEVPCTNIQSGTTFEQITGGMSIRLIKD